MKNKHKVLILVMGLQQMIGSMAVAGEIWTTKRKILQVSTEVINDKVDTDRDFTAVSICGKDKRIFNSDISNDFLDKAYREAEGSEDEESFMGDGDLLIISNDKASFLVLFESSGIRFQISPLEEVAEGWFVQSKFSHISRDKKVIEVLSEARTLVSHDRIPTDVAYPIEFKSGVENIFIAVIPEKSAVFKNEGIKIEVMIFNNSDRDFSFIATSDSDGLGHDIVGVIVKFLPGENDEKSTISRVSYSQGGSNFKTHRIRSGSMLVLRSNFVPFRDIDAPAFGYFSLNLGDIVSGQFGLSLQAPRRDAQPPESNRKTE